MRADAMLRATLFVAALGESSVAIAGCTDTVQGDGHVAGVIDGITLRMDDGAEIRLAGLAPLPGDGTALAALVQGRAVTLYGDSDMPDRYGRQSAFILVDGEPIAVQLQLLAQGEALMAGTTTPRGCAQELAGAEAVARRGRRGVWGRDTVIKKAVIPGDILAALGRFVVVEGRIVSVREAGATIYLNFGRRWTRDFAVTISRRMMAAFAGAGITQKSLERRRIRVRGWVEGTTSPRIEARDVGQIEMIEEQAVGDR